MAYAEKRGKGPRPWRVRYKRPDGEYESESGFATKKEALAFGDDQESLIRRREWNDPRKAEQLISDWAQEWFDNQHLELSTLDSYAHMLEAWILPRWGDYTLSGIVDAEHEITPWEAQLRKGSSVSNATKCRTLLSTMLSDAVPSRIPRNPAQRGRARGKVADRRQLYTVEEKAWVTPFQLLQLAERAAILAGRDDEFILLVTAAYTGMRFGELLGLEHDLWHGDIIDVHHQMYTLTSGSTIRKDPKDGSVRSIDVPPFLQALLARQAEANPPQVSTSQVCECVYSKQLHEDSEEDPDYFKEFLKDYSHPVGIHMFTGPLEKRAKRGTLSHKELARISGVSTGTIFNVMNKPDKVTPATRDRVLKVMAENSYVHRRPVGRSPHLCRSVFPAWVLGPATSGSYPSKDSEGIAARSVPLTTRQGTGPQLLAPHPEGPRSGQWAAHTGDLAGEVLQGIHKTTAVTVPLQGRGASVRATASWLPIEPDLTMHGLRHSHKTWLDDDRVVDKLKDERMGHIDTRIQAHYSHVSEDARNHLLKCLTNRWRGSLREFLAMREWSPVPVLHEVLQEEVRRKEEAASSRVSQISPTRARGSRRLRAKKTA